MCEWRLYDGGEHNNCELEIWQLVDSDGEVLEEYDIEDLKAQGATWDLWSGEDRGQYVHFDDEND